LRKEGVHLHLVERGDDTPRLFYILDVVRLEVADPDGAGLAGGVYPFKRKPRVFVEAFARPMDDI
jgi:hypothetical protein